MLDFVQRHRPAHDGMLQLIPYPGDMPDAVFRIHHQLEERGLNGVVVDYVFQHQSVVGVYPEGDLLLLAPLAVDDGVQMGHSQDECVELFSVGLEAFVIDHAAVVNVRPEHNGVVVVAERVNPRPCGPSRGRSSYRNDGDR